MAAYTRAQVAARVHERLDDLGAEFTDADDGGTRTEGDYTYCIDDALQDCGFDAISEGTTHAQKRAILLGTTWYAYQRAFNRLAAKANSQQGAGVSGTHVRIDWESASKSLRLQMAATQKLYMAALKAIGRALDTDPDSSRVAAQAVMLEYEGTTADEAAYELPWWKEAYNIIDRGDS